MLISLMVAISGCTQYDSYEVRSCEDKLSAEAKIGVSSSYEIVHKSKVLNFYGEVKSESESVVYSCQIDTCLPSYMRVSSLKSEYSSAISANPMMSPQIPLDQYPDQLCILKAEASCPSSKYQSLDFTKILALEGSENASYSVRDVVVYSNPTCSEDSENPSCGEGLVLNPETSECVVLEASCSLEELPPGASVGYKLWSEEMNEYGECQIDSCQPGYELEEGSCVMTQMDPCDINPEMNPACPEYNMCVAFPMMPGCPGYNECEMSVDCI